MSMNISFSSSIVGSRLAAPKFTISQSLKAMPRCVSVVAARPVQVFHKSYDTCTSQDPTVEQLNRNLGHLHRMILKPAMGLAAIALLISCTIKLHLLGGSKFAGQHVTDYKAKEAGGHMEFFFQCNGYACRVTSLHANGFRGFPWEKLRNHYLEELTTCQQYDAVGGKSQATFCKTGGGHFIIKSIQKTEFETFRLYGKQYLEHIQANQSCLNRPWGVYEIVVGNKKTYILVTDIITIPESDKINLYDLKGFTLKRKNLDNVGTGLDQNFVQEMRTSGFFLTDKDMDELLECVRNDAHFLKSINVMDYSLLVVWDKNKRVVVYGMIDYLRRFTPDKWVEFMYKSFILMRASPTVVPPSNYAFRLTEFIQKEFQTTPTFSTKEWSPSAAFASPSNSSCSSSDMSDS